MRKLDTKFYIIPYVINTSESVLIVRKNKIKVITLLKLYTIVTKRYRTYAYMNLLPYLWNELIKYCKIFNCTSLNKVV